MFVFIRSKMFFTELISYFDNNPYLTSYLLLYINLKVKNTWSMPGVMSGLFNRNYDYTFYIAALVLTVVSKYMN